MRASVLEQSPAFGPFVRQLVAFTKVTRRTRQHKIARIIRSAACERHNMIDMVFSQLASAVITLSMLRLVHGANVGKCINAARCIFERSAVSVTNAIFGFVCYVVLVCILLSLSWVNAQLNLRPMQLLPITGLSSRFFGISPIFFAIAYAVCLSVFSVGFIFDCAIMLRISVIFLIALLLQRFLIAASIISTGCAVAFFALACVPGFSVTTTIERTEWFSNAASRAAFGRGIHSAPHYAVSQDVCSQGGMSAARSGATLDCLAILPQNGAKS